MSKKYIYIYIYFDGCALRQTQSEDNLFVIKYLAILGDLSYVMCDFKSTFKKKTPLRLSSKPLRRGAFFFNRVTPINPFQNFATWNSPIHLNLSCWAPVLDFGVRWAIWLHVTSRGIPIRFCVGDLKWFNRWENKKRSSAKQVNILSKVTLHLCNLEQQYVYIYIYTYVYIYIQFRIS